MSGFNAMINEDVRHIIEAGDAVSFSRNPADWVFWDMSFSKSSSSGLILPNGEEVTTTWSHACDLVIQHLSTRNSDINIIIEAPLSFSFKNGSPIRRAFEPTNYEWYRNAGAGLAWGAALVLLDVAKTSKSKVLLYEAFITNANKSRTNTRSDNHLRDARLMCRHITDEVTVLRTELNLKDTMIESSTKRLGLDFGCPPVLIADKE
jgi:hypothetical protein